MKANEERKELQRILDNSPSEISKNVPTEEIPGLQAEPVTTVDFDELRKECLEEAEVMIVNAIAFMIPTEMIEGNEYLKNKMKVDIISLSGMIYQLRTNEVMQKALIDQINLGMVNARMFEVFTGMSKTVGELNKQLIQTVEAIKETYRAFKNDVKEKNTEAIGPAQTGTTNGILKSGDGSVVTRGTKELINNVKRIKSEGYIDDAGLIPNINIEPIEE